MGVLLHGLKTASWFAMVLWDSVQVPLALWARSGDCCKSQSTRCVDKLFPGKNWRLRFIVESAPEWGEGQELTTSLRLWGGSSHHLDACWVEAGLFHRSLWIMQSNPWKQSLGDECFCRSPHWALSPEQVAMLLCGPRSPGTPEWKPCWLSEPSNLGPSVWWKSSKLGG